MYDVAADRAFVVGKAGEEWEGLGLVSGSAARFIAGKERGGTRDLFWVDLPR